jgi:hypothetical protein
MARARNLSAHDTSAVDDFAIALLCGDAEFKVRQLSSRFLCLFLLAIS